MSPDQSSAEVDSHKEISALIETLLITEQRLEQLTAGEVDAFTGQDGQIFLLRRAQEQLRHNEATNQASILNALPAHIALLDAQGTIISVNEAWRRFANANGMQTPNYALGVNYLKVCDEAYGPHSAEAHRVAAGIRWVLNGLEKSFSIEYSCHSRTEQRWFLLTVTPLSEDFPNGVVIMHLNITQRKQAEIALRESNDKFQLLTDHITDAFWIRSSDMSEVLYISPAFERIWGRSVESLYANPQQWTDFILADDREDVVNAFTALIRDSKSLDIEYRIVRPTGEIRWIRVRGFPVQDAANNLFRHIGIVSDITDRKQTEAQFVQSQKMETVGKLAGGIAHEFNSILTTIIGQSEWLLDALPEDSPLSKNATEISQAASRAAALTRQLLAYGRKQFLRPETLDLNRVLADMKEMLHHLMGRGVDTQITLASDLHAVKADAGQIEQVIVNLAINARDAMPNGGTLTLKTTNVTFDEVSAQRHLEWKPGDYAMLTITDTGSGISEDVKPHIFEPFFTTKDVGQGTGLGLSTCYGIIKQSGGHIQFHSEVGSGTTFEIFLPRVEPRSKTPIQRLDSPGLPRGIETILLVEGDPALREMAATLLSRLGYTVLTAANDLEALSLTEQHTFKQVDLLITALVMPHMSGKELHARLRALLPHVRIVFTSTHTANINGHQGTLTKGAVLLTKPFTPSALAQKVREALSANDAV